MVSAGRWDKSHRAHISELDRVPQAGRGKTFVGQVPSNFFDANSLLPSPTSPSKPRAPGRIVSWGLRSYLRGVLLYVLPCRMGESCDAAPRGIICGLYNARLTTNSVCTLRENCNVDKGRAQGYADIRTRYLPTLFFSAA